MSIRNVAESWSEAELGEDKGRRVFTVLLDGTDSPAARLAQAQTAAGIPRRGEVHPFRPAITASEPTVRCKAPYLYEVRVEYSISGGGRIEADKGPLAQRPTRRWSWQSSTEQVDWDFAGKPIVNSAGQPLDPPLTMEIIDPVLEISRNEPLRDASSMIAYRMAINSDPFYGAAPGQARMLSVSSEEVQEEKLVYLRTIYRIAFRPGPQGEADAEKKAWCTRVMDQGTCEGGDWGQGHELKPIYDEHGVPISSPVKLDGNGKELADKDKAIWLYFETGPRMPFKPLGLEFT